MDPFDSRNAERVNLPRNMIENSMFEEEPDVVDLAKDSTSFPSFPPLDPDDVVYEPRSSRLLVRGLGENDMDDEEEDCESSARLLGMSFMNRSSAQRVAASPFSRQSPSGSCSRPSARTMVVCVLLLVIVVAMSMVLYLLPECTFTKSGCPKQNKTSPPETVYPISSNGEVFPWAQLRLPQSIRPLSYSLTLNPDLDKMTFTGCTVITMFVRHNTKHVVLHGVNLNFTKATFKIGDGKATAVTVLEYKPKQQIAVKFTEELKAGQLCVLTLDYTADLSHSYDGFYNSSYTDKEGTKKVLAATQFEPLSARKAFPCFDEPSFKATFLIKISHKSDYMALSNMPKVKTIKLQNDLLLDEFEKTSVNMSTYLVAFIVANFTPISKNVSNTLLSVYSVPEKKEHTSYALEAASKLLDFYNNFFEIPYPLQKLDLVAIPDFLAGAMENWGLITFRETSLLVGSLSSALEKQLVASVVAHEVAHQWFGNLVTMSWWNDLWLNEGFATYMQYMSIQNVLPELDIENVFLDVRLRAMEKDALNSSHAVSTEVNTPEQVEEMFDSVSYEKGASILLMLKASLPGDQQFRKGIIQYLKQFSGLNTYTNDLWNSLTQVKLSTQHQNVTEMMSLWTSQKGFPLVTVSYKGDEVTLTQEHFLLTSDNATQSSSLWHIPVSYVNDSCSLAADCRQLFTLKTKSNTLKLPEKVKWLKLNYRNTGFYIVDYGKEGWSELCDALANNYQVLTSEDRTSLIHNIFALSRLRRVSFPQVHQLLKYLSNETETSPVTEALLQLNTIYRLLDKRYEHGLVARLKEYMLSLFGSLIRNQTWTEIESVSKQELRSALLETACQLHEESCIKQAKDIFKDYVDSNGTKRIPGDLQQVVFNVAAQSDDWATLLTLYGNASYDSEKRKMLKALSSTKDPQQIVWILQEGIRGHIVQTQELPLVIGTVCNGFAGFLFAWDFIQENWDRLIEKFPVGSFAIQRIVKSVTSQFSTKSHLDQVQSFFSSLKERGSNMRSVQEALETIKLNQRWMDSNLASLRKSL
ncbi:leucyl-cystinyl aminopeptidase isoform X2 [Eucyclogobius newberryi]|uniref:leucyl-cystinyl aminopeptidase isoform X2 n=1 Tax=Eucyclogobius newberryi TaxID=166745 RepID=UPI003B5C9347